MSFPEIVTKNLARKIISFLIAVFIWFAIYSLQHDVRLSRNHNLVTKTFHNHPITVMKAALDSHGYRVNPSEVEVILRGPANILNSLTEKDIEVYINLTDVVDVVRLRKKVLIFVPEGVTVVNVNPPFVTVEKAD
ncbi:MAG: CdaR family protein [Verrucomicrobiia bacterium]